MIFSDYKRLPRTRTTSEKRLRNWAGFREVFWHIYAPVLNDNSHVVFRKSRMIGLHTYVSAPGTSEVQQSAATMSFHDGAYVLDT